MKNVKYLILPVVLAALVFGAAFANAEPLGGEASGIKAWHLEDGMDRPILLAYDCYLADLGQGRAFCVREGMRLIPLFAAEPQDSQPGEESLTQSMLVGSAVIRLNPEGGILSGWIVLSKGMTVAIPAGVLEGNRELPSFINKTIQGSDDRGGPVDIWTKINGYIPGEKWEAKGKGGEIARDPEHQPDQSGGVNNNPKMKED